MGPIPSTDGHEQYFSDIYICSYISTLGALIEARSPPTPKIDLTPSLLFVGPAVPVSGLERGMVAIKKSRIPLTPLVQGAATKQAVIDGLQRHPFAHFSCYGVHKARDPFSAEILLDCNERLSLLDVVRTRIPTTELIVLIFHRNPNMMETEGCLEELQLASIMHYYGYRSVVGTIWGVLDVDALDFSEAFYTTLLSRGAAQLGEKSAEALRYAVQRLRREGMPLERWVNWIHYGV
jgi:CHAT domain-containing protein